MLLGRLFHLPDRSRIVRGQVEFIDTGGLFKVLRTELDQNVTSEPLSDTDVIRSYTRCAQSPTHGGTKMAEIRVVSCPLCGRVAGQKAIRRAGSYIKVGSTNF